MSFLTDEEKDRLEIKRMIFHVVGRDVEEATLLEEVAPPAYADFFVERVRSALRGNLFAFKEGSEVETILRDIEGDARLFTERTQGLAKQFHRLHTAPTSTGCLFVFEISVGAPRSVFAIIKYDNDDVVRYILRRGDTPQAPRLERFHQSFVRKAESMQKIALVRLKDAGGLIMVRDRSNPAHISDYFERFLQVRRVNSPDDMSGKLVLALKETFKAHRNSLPDDVKRGGVNRIYDTLRQGAHRFDPDDCEPLIASVFGQVDPDSPLRRTLQRQLRQHGVSEETFVVNPDRVHKPTRRRLETDEGTIITYDAANAPVRKPRADGRVEITIVTTGVKSDDVDTETRQRSR